MIIAENRGFLKKNKFFWILMDFWWIFIGFLNFSSILMFLWLTWTIQRRKSIWRLCRIFCRPDRHSSPWTCRQIWFRTFSEGFFSHFKWKSIIKTHFLKKISKFPIKNRRFRLKIAKKRGKMEFEKMEFKGASI